MSTESAVGGLLRKKRLTLAVAESCTGGLVSDRITDVAGSSDYFRGGVIAYSNAIKTRVLGVRAASLGRFGAVSAQVALEMARGVRKLAHSDIGIGITGIAGPAGRTKAKPVGLVYIALASKNKNIVDEFRLKGPRRSIKRQASQKALNLTCGHLSR
jgi:nicotinamide-nucleotide amidase